MKVSELRKQLVGVPGRYEIRLVRYPEDEAEDEGHREWAKPAIFELPLDRMMTDDCDELLLLFAPDEGGGKGGV